MVFLLLLVTTTAPLVFLGWNSLQKLDIARVEYRGGAFGPLSCDIEARNLDALALSEFQTRLRLLASHPRLYDPQTKLESSKLQRFLELVDELRHDLTDAADEPVPVYPFAYDWRQPLDAVEEQLDRGD